MFTDFMAGFGNRGYSITFFDVWGVFDVCSRIAAYRWCIAHKSAGLSRSFPYSQPHPWDCPFTRSRFLRHAIENGLPRTDTPSCLVEMKAALTRSSSVTITPDRSSGAIYRVKP